jgi:hypothetical protein
VLFGPDRNGDGRQDLYVTSAQVNDSSFANSKPHTSSVKVYDGVTGAYLSDFVAVDSGGLNSPILMTFTETDPVTLAYVGSSAASSRVAAASTSVHADRNSTLTDPTEAFSSLIVTLMLRNDASTHGPINFIFGQSWGAVPGMNNIHVTGTVSSMATAEDGTVTLRGRLTERDWDGVFTKEDVPFRIVLRPGSQFTLQWCELPTFELELTDGNLVIH